MGQSGRSRDQHHGERDRLWLEALQYALELPPPDDGESGHRALPPGRSRPRVRVLDVSDSGHRVQIELRFLSGERYCCAEPGCFLGTYDPAWWNGVRVRLKQVSDRDPPPMSLAIVGVVEEGAEFESHRGLLPLASPAYAYTDGPVREADAGR